MRAWYLILNNMKVTSGQPDNWLFDKVTLKKPLKAGRDTLVVEIAPLKFVNQELAKIGQVFTVGKNGALTLEEKKD